MLSSRTRQLSSGLQRDAAYLHQEKQQISTSYDNPEKPMPLSFTHHTANEDDDDDVAILRKQKTKRSSGSIPASKRSSTGGAGSSRKKRHSFYYKSGKIVLSRPSPSALHRAGRLSQSVIDHYRTLHRQQQQQQQEEDARSISISTPLTNVSSAIVTSGHGHTIGNNTSVSTGAMTATTATAAAATTGDLSCVVSHIQQLAQQTTNQTQQITDLQASQQKILSELTHEQAQRRAMEQSHLTEMNSLQLLHKNELLELEARIRREHDEEMTRFMEELQHDAELVREKLKDLQTLCHTLTVENTQLKLDKKALEDNLSLSQQHIEEEQMQKSDQQQQLTSTVEELNDLQSQHNTLMEDYNTLLSTNNGLQKTIIRLNGQLDQLQGVNRHHQSRMRTSTVPKVNPVNPGKSCIAPSVNQCQPQAKNNRRILSPSELKEPIELD